jgi:hypothetical protein
MALERRAILEELLADPKWKFKLNAAKTWEHAVAIIKEFCKERGYEAKCIKTEG